jgi:general secretion pathway protein B
MSYILDALKKSDQQRQRGATPTLQTSQSIEAPRHTGRAWLYLSLAVAVAAGAFGLGSLRPWRTEPVVVAVPSPLASPASLAAPDAAAFTAPVAAPAATPSTTSSPHTPPVAQTEAVTQTTAKEPAKITSVEQQRQMPARPPSQEAPAPAGDAPSAQKAATLPGSATAREEKASEDKVVALADLPASIRAELPPMNITVHAYTRAPKDRLVGVNDKLLREGDTLAPDLVLERITPDGMVFTYKGTRFQRGVR